MHKRLLLAIIVAALIVGMAQVRAHDEERISGTVAQVTLTALSVRQQNGRAISVKLVPSTKVTKNGQKASVLDLQIGLAVAVDAHEDDDENLVAVEVRIVPSGK